MNIETVKDVEVITPLNSCWEAPENDLAGKRLHCFISDEYSDDEAMAVLMLRALSGKPLTVAVREWLGDDAASTSEIPEIVLSMLKSRDQYPLVLGVGIGKGIHNAFVLNFLYINLGIKCFMPWLFTHVR